MSASHWGINDPEAGLTRRGFLLAALMASGAVLLGPAGGIVLAASRTGPWQADWPTRENPITEDTPGRTVKLYTELSLEHLTETTGHWGIGCASGSLADRFILLSPADPGAFHDALARMGARPGNNLAIDSYGRYVSGDALSVAVVWPGLKVPLDLKDIFYDGAGKGFMIRFGGNRDAALRHRTGCLTCLESCPVGITSNAAYPHIRGIRRALRPNSAFRGRPEVLPRKDGFPLVVSYRLEVKG
jgi:hypothetical protein